MNQYSVSLFLVGSVCVTVQAKNAGEAERQATKLFAEGHFKDDLNEVVYVDKTSTDVDLIEEGLKF